MKRLWFFLAALLLISAGSLPSYSAETGHRASASESKDQKRQYEKSMQERLGNLGKKLDELKAKTETLGEQAKKDVGGYLAVAEKKQAAATRKLERLQKKSERKWKKFASEVDRAADDFEEALAKAKSRFRE